MDTNRLGHWLELAGSVVVLVGLGLLALELRQTSDITRAELATGSLDTLLEISSQLATTQFSNTYAKMLETPRDLTAAEMLELNGFYWQIAGVFRREVALKRRGIFEEDENIIRRVVPQYFANAYAQSWWLTNKHRFPARVVELVDEELSKLAEDRNIQELAEIQSNI